MGLHPELLPWFEFAFAAEPNRRTTRSGLGSCTGEARSHPTELPSLASSTTDSTFWQRLKGLWSHPHAAVCIPGLATENFL